jgi:4-hydroxy-tetrahydrodipicolinate synthase
MSLHARLIGAALCVATFAAPLPVLADAAPLDLATAGACALDRVREIVAGATQHSEDETERNTLIVAIKESCDDIRRSIEMINRFGDRFDLFTGVDNLAYEALAVGAIGWVAGLVNAFPKETVAIYRLMKAGRSAEALAIYRWFRPLLDLDVSTYLVQNIKLAEAVAIRTNDRVRMPRKAHSGARRTAIEKLVKESIANRPELPKL